MIKILGVLPLAIGGWFLFSMAVLLLSLGFLWQIFQADSHKVLVAQDSIDQIAAYEEIYPAFRWVLGARGEDYYGRAERDGTD